MAHWEMDAVPSAHGVPTCRIPCQWITSPSVWSLLFTVTLTTSPARAVIVGPGNVPLIPIITRCWQSGAHMMYSTSHVVSSFAGRVGTGAEAAVVPEGAAPEARARRSDVQQSSSCTARRSLV